MARKGRQIVEHKDGRLGVFYTNAKLVNGKVPVYIATKTHVSFGLKIPTEFSETNILCDPNELKFIGYLD